MGALPLYQHHRYKQECQRPVAALLLVLLNSCSIPAPALTLAAIQDSRGGCMQVRKVAEENGVDVSGQIRELEERAKQVCIFCCPCVLLNGRDMPDFAMLPCKSSALPVSWWHPWQSLSMPVASKALHLHPAVTEGHILPPDTCTEAASGQASQSAYLSGRRPQHQRQVSCAQGP